MDKLTPEHRSWNMRRIQSGNTKPELIVRSMLHRLGYCFRVHRKDLPGKPDIVLPKYNSIIFVHGCFWHRHAACKYAYTPKSRVNFWKQKFTQNIERDKRNIQVLNEKGWNVLVIWECETKNMDVLIKKVNSFLTAS